ncbi:MAG TPA: hypothetical protein VF170_01820 [Planctomycetaceae bacterium]
MNDRIPVLDPWQVWDVGRGCYFVGLQRTKQKHQGHPVYKDATGRRVAIRGAE